ncbi:MAG: amino acid racemase [Lachnospiraceae bacterium]|nr:amino acid racemase [Lachnospiraceae bacterium]
MKKLGIIGGLGPMATARFMMMITQMSEAEKDQDHFETIIISRPQVPDRTAYILDQTNPDPAPALVGIARELCEAGAEILVMPCFSAHYFYDTISETVKVPVIHAIDEISARLENANIKKIGLLATDGLIQSHIFTDKLDKTGIEVISPDEAGQKKVMQMIYHELKGGRDVDLTKLKQVSEDLLSHGAEIILLGCSELSLLKTRYSLTDEYLDALELLAGQAVLRCGKLKSCYQRPIKASRNHAI